MPTAEEAREWLAHALADDELAHYGVLGMKWGVRKDLGPAGSNSSSSTSSNSQAKPVRVSQAKDTKLTTGDKVVLGFYGTAAVGFAGVAVGPDVAKGVGKLGAPLYKKTIVEDLKKIQQYTAGVDNGKNFLTDKVNTNVPAGTVFHRVASRAETEINAPKYATYLQDDVLKYRNSWVTPGRFEMQRHYVTSMEALKNVTIASPDSIHKTVANNMHTLMDDGESLLTKYLRIGAVGKYYTPDIVDKIKTDPDYFARHIINHNRLNIWADDIGTGTSYWMKQAGYSAVTDINNTGSQARKHAVIVLDRDAFKVTSRRLTQFERQAAAVAQRAIANPNAISVTQRIVQNKTVQRAATRAAKIVIRKP